MYYGLRHHGPALRTPDDRHGHRTVPQRLGQSPEVINGTALPERYAPRFVSGDPVFVLQRQSDVIEPLKQAVAPERVNVKADLQTRIFADRPPFQINRQLIAFPRLRALEQLFHLLFAQADRQHPVLEAVIEKDVRERRRDDPHPKLVRVSRMLAPLNLGWFSSKSGFSDPSELNRQSKKSASSKPERLIRLRNCFGMI